MKKNQTTKDDSGRDSIMVRTDLTIRDLMEEKPSSRWDVEFWNPKFDDTYKALASLKKTVPIKEILVDKEVISCDHMRASRNEKLGSYETAYFTVDHILPTGYDDNFIVFVSDNSYERLKRTALRHGDIALAGSGRGSVGKSLLYRSRFKKAIVGDLFILRTEKILPSFLQIFLQSVFGQAQIQRHESGVSGQTHINKQEIEEFLIPILSDSIQKNIEAEYKKMSTYHDRAMDAKKKGDEAGYMENMETAKKILKDLIAKTEAVIRGERKDVI